MPEQPFFSLFSSKIVLILSLSVLLFPGSEAFGENGQVPMNLEGLPLVLHELFERGASGWTPTDPNVWEVTVDEGRRVYHLKGESHYTPPVRSPKSYSLVDDFHVGDFILEARVKQTSRDYGHRDLCFFFGYRDPSHYYYVHLATVADPNANSIFLVNGEPRVSIAETRTEGTDWGRDVYHWVRIRRDCASGRIEVFFNDFSTPVMIATDRTFPDGRIGIGSFDDSGMFDEVRVWGRMVYPGPDGIPQE